MVYICKQNMKYICIYNIIVISKLLSVFTVDTSYYWYPNMCIYN